jgi:hypothetical protein
MVGCTREGVSPRSQVALGNALSLPELIRFAKPRPALDLLSSQHVFYEVLAPGCHSSLTKNQIADLFRAGRLGRSHRCKLVSQKEWRTVDELFPLLKYESATISYDSPCGPANPSPKTWGLVFAFLIAVCGIGALWYYFGYAASSTPESNPLRVTETRWPKTVSTNSAPDSLTSVAVEPSQRSESAATTYATQSTAEATRIQPAAQQRQAAEQQRQETSLAQLQEERARQEEKARGQDTIIPLDQYRVVNVGGVGVSVKVHDNDVTSFDVWINGTPYREVRKQKGITQSGTDETLIYNAGRARLYYVWELSGQLNHCRVRVRED